MPSADQLATLPAATADDGSSQTANDDGSTTTTWPDGTSRVDYADGSTMVTFTDGAVLNVYPDGTRTLNDVNGVALDPATGAPPSGGGELPTPPDQTPDHLLRLINGDDTVSDIQEAVDLVKTFADTIGGELDPTEWVKQWFMALLAGIKALETEERGCYMRGWCYTVLYSALDMGRPPEPAFSGSLQGPDQDALDRQNWGEGVQAAEQQLAERPSGTALRNRVLLRLAQDGNQPAVTLNTLWQAACAHTDDTMLARAYEQIDWPQPTGA
jgi:hypothetical protein